MHRFIMLYFFVLLIAISNVVLANPVPNDLDIGTSSVDNIDSLVSSTDLNGCTSDASSDPSSDLSSDLSGEKTDSDPNGGISRRDSPGYCPTDYGKYRPLTTESLKKKKKKGRIVPVQTPTGAPLKKTSPGDPTKGTLTGESANPCSGRTDREEYVTCGGPEVRDSQTGELYYVTNCVPGKSRSRPNQIKS